ncbi:Alpha/Beta hydrolase protein [Dactylonectria estremocensis]|uniref:Alpha/Beta hydrolase protein n=1 Tax=Dactylonectria estremocensis TaxID=1079267 RepID=A0A9P9E6C1_9HYPO|nr:Alpha/Beta hydrolase protein [Dactylonectria estremocensis]
MEHQEFVFKLDPRGQPIEADVYFSPGTQEATSRPAAIMFHGGGFVIGAKERIPPQHIKMLIELGFIVVVPNYRLAPTISMYEGPFQDSKDAYTWCQTDLPKLLPTGLSVDSQRMVAIGYSAGATLALLLASMQTKPRAILDFYGPLNFSDKFWHSPLPSLADLPPFPPELLAKVFEEEDPSSVASSLERPSPDSNAAPKLDLSRPRNAWLFNAMKEGHHLRSVVGDGDYARVDPISFFSGEFPPTAFIHGNQDTLVEFRFSKDAYEALQKLGVETQLLEIEGKNHGFDAGIEEGMEGWDKIQAGLEFLANHV